MNSINHHLLVSAAFRFEKVVEEVDQDFARFSAISGSRTALEIVNHLVNVLANAESILTERESMVWRTTQWEEGKHQFDFVLHQLMDFIDENDIEDEMMEVIIHGPLTDVFGHIGQLAMLRRMAGKPVKRVNYMKAPLNLRPQLSAKASQLKG